MSLYHEAAPLIVSSADSEGSLKSKIFGRKDLKSQPKQLYALVSEAAKWSPILVDVIEKAQLLQVERKLSPNLALLLVHDLLLSKGGISAPASHPLRLNVERHKARLNAELTKARLRRGIPSTDALRAEVNAGNLRPEKERNGNGLEGGRPVENHSPYPRWVRINTIKTTLDEQRRTTFTSYKAVDSLDELRKGFLKSDREALYCDKHVPNLVAVSPSIDLTKTSAYLSGLIILQDKASCFPAYLLDADPRDGSILDACAAPGNKTTHLAALLQEKGNDAYPVTTHACERDKSRAILLEKMVQIAGVSRYVDIRHGQDFLRIKPDQAPWKDVGSLLLDPSCSGSGIVSRDGKLEVMLPMKSRVQVTKKKGSKKRKRDTTVAVNQETVDVQEEIPIKEAKSSDNPSERLSALSTFQLKLLTYAFTFPAARKITYSTCSIYAEENEHVVMKALSSDSCRSLGWRILPRDQQITGMKEWPVRGDPQVCGKANGVDSVEKIAEACIRCSKGDQEGTQGFFVAAFIRDVHTGVPESLDEEWSGFEDD